MAVEREALGALMAEVADLRTEVAALGQMLASQRAQTALLDALLAAVTGHGEQGGDDGLAEVLVRIADGLDAIPGAVAAAVHGGR